MAKKEAGEFYKKSDIRGSIKKCQDAFDSGIFSSDGIEHPLFEASVVFVLIHLSDLMAKARIDGNRINFAEEVSVTEKIADVTDLVRECRNSACHISSGEHMIDDTFKFTFNVVAGLVPNAIQIGSNKFGCDFSDDIAIYYGDKRLYIKRHLARALQEISALYASYT